MYGKLMRVFSSRLFMPIEGWVGSVLALSAILFTGSAAGGDEQQLDRAVRAIAAALPPEWTITEQKSGEIPYGHHWDENYSGPRGTLVVVKGRKLVYAEFSDTTGKWQKEAVAVEGLKIWLMPSNYSNSRLAFLAIKRPVQPTTVVGNGPVKVYAAPWPVLVSEKGFEARLQKSAGIRWADPQVDSPGFLTWKDWPRKLRKATENGVSP